MSQQYLGRNKNLKKQMSLYTLRKFIFQSHQSCFKVNTLIVFVLLNFNPPVSLLFQPAPTPLSTFCDSFFSQSTVKYPWLWSIMAVRQFFFLSSRSLQTPFPYFSCVPLFRYHLVVGWLEDGVCIHAPNNAGNNKGGWGWC